jgi:hypothetical protein
MKAYDNTNSGILTINDKDGNPARPDRKGTINVDGVEYWISGWIKDGREGTKLEGQKYMSLKLEKKEQAYSPKRTSPAAVSETIDF